MITKKSCFLKIGDATDVASDFAYLLTACKVTKKMIIKQKKSSFLFGSMKNTPK